MATTTSAAGLEEKSLGGAARSPTSDSESVLSQAVESAAVGADGEEQPAGLPFSKARCIALVITVTGAAFLNVSRCSILVSPTAVRDQRDTRQCPPRRL